MNIKNIVFKWVPVVVWAGVIFYLSGMSATSASENRLIDHLLHDLAHVIEYGIFFVLLIRAIDESSISLPRLTFLLVLLYALSDEAHQYFVPTRSAKIEDILFDLLGGFLAWKFLQRLQKRKLKI
jgi:VanZ family protein